MKNPFITIAILLSGAALNAQGLNDGPYVFRTNGLVVQERSQDGWLRRDTLYGPNKEVAIVFKAHPDWDFSVRLRDTLVNEPVEFPQPDSLFVLSDIEGEFEGFRSLLLSNHIIDSAYNWRFAKGHLIMCGDLFDRGEQVPEVIWLLYKLEQSARLAGGYVHTILGNHDIMNLSGDLRYLQPKYLEAASILGRDYMDLYAKDTELGCWLRTKNTIEKIGENLCAHAGVAPFVNALGWSLSDINSKCRPFYDRAMDLKESGEALIAPFFSGSTSLFWYRGYFMEPKATASDVDATLRLYNCKRILVGHTIVPGNVGMLYGGKVLALDVNQHQGDHQAAFYRGGQWFKVNDKGTQHAL